MFHAVKEGNQVFDGHCGSLIGDLFKKIRFILISKFFHQLKFQLLF